MKLQKWMSVGLVVGVVCGGLVDAASAQGELRTPAQHTPGDLHVELRTGGDARLVISGGRANVPAAIVFAVESDTVPLMPADPRQVLSGALLGTAIITLDDAGGVSLPFPLHLLGPQAKLYIQVVSGKPGCEGSLSCVEVSNVLEIRGRQQPVKVGGTVTPAAGAEG